MGHREATKWTNHRRAMTVRHSSSGHTPDPPVMSGIQLDPKHQDVPRPPPRTSYSLFFIAYRATPLLALSLHHPAPQSVRQTEAVCWREGSKRARGF